MNQKKEKLKKKIRIFRNEKDKADLWKNADSTDKIDWNNAESETFPNLKPSIKNISPRLPELPITR